MNNKNLMNYVFTSKYAKHKGGRREGYEETVSRMLSMYTDIPPSVSDALLQKKIASSQRAMQFGGTAIEEKNARIYNCTVSFCDRLSFFSEAFYLLLCGCGVGFSVQKHHVAQLPPLNKGLGEYYPIIEDSIEGWANSITPLLDHYFNEGMRPQFDYSLIRPEGAPLRHGGKAPGSAPLEKAHTKIFELLDNATEVTPLLVFDITMHLADAVISGGIRRSATIAIFSPDDEEMIRSKTGDWFNSNPQRGRANISAMITPDTDKAVYDRLFSATKEFGEPACIFSKSTEYINNPCVEITMCPLLIEKNGVVVENYTLDLVNNRDPEYTYTSGWQFCNLTTINAEAQASKEEFLSSVRSATILGTHQASFLSLLSPTTQKIVARESLLGVSITGILANPKVRDWMSEGAELAIRTNQEWASKLGIRPASRITCVKPEGTASLVLGTAPGIHPYHSSHFIRRVQANRYEPVYQLYQSVNPDHCLDSVWADKVVEFPCSAPPGAITKDDLTAIEHLKIALQVNRDWVRKGTALPDRLEGAHHNVSITVTVKEDEWDEVREYLWENKEWYTGVSLLASSGDYDYQQAPLQKVYFDSDLEEHQEIAKRYTELLETNRDCDFSLFREEEDNTTPVENIACGGGQCLL